MSIRWQKFNYSEWQEKNKAFDHKTWDARMEQVHEQSDGKLEKWMEGSMKLLKDIGRPPFRPNAFYNEPGDQLEVYLSDVSFYGHWLHPEMSVYLGQGHEDDPNYIKEDTDQVVGVVVHGLSRILAKQGYRLVPKELDPNSDDV